ncbi:MAG: flippase-like domain-containing protein [Candidatus Aenigmarchaeota archaeon]|nr:flippase-like domain-containing protein [Candidatus Aenigmarchaeota archaeon]
MKKVIGLLLGIFLFFGVIFFFGGTEILTVLLSVNPYYFGGAVLVQIIIILLYALRLRLIVSEQGYKIGFGRILKILSAGMAINQLTPVVKAAGEPVKMHYLSKSGMPVTKAGAATVVEISSDLISFYVILFLSILLLSFEKYLSQNFLYAGGMVFILFIAVIIISFKFMLNEDKLERFFGRFLMKYFKKDAKVSTKVFTSSLRHLFTCRKLGFKIFSISFLCRFLDIARIYLLFEALHFSSPLTFALVLWVITFMFSMIPWLPGGLGLVEGGAIPVLMLLGISASVSSSLILLERFLTFWFIILIGGVSFHILNKEFKENYGIK